MKITIVGAGRFGAAMGLGLSRSGHQVIFGVRDPHAEKVAKVVEACAAGTRAVTVEESAAGADVVILATPWAETERVISQLGELRGRILIDATNPIVIGADELSRGLLIGHSTSAGEEVAKWAKDALVVKAFNTTGSGNISNPVYGDRKAITFVAGDNANAREVACQLARDLGLEPFDAGGLQMARLLEPLGLLWIKMAYGQGWGPDFTFDVLKRSSEAGR